MHERHYEKHRSLFPFVMFVEGYCVDSAPGGALSAAERVKAAGFAIEQLFELRQPGSGHLQDAVDSAIYGDTVGGPRKAAAA